MRRVVVTIHGVGTRGEWQKGITPVLSRGGHVLYLLDYGHFPHLRVALPWARNGRRQWLYEELHKICTQEKVERISVIAHSFGSYLLLQVLKKHRNIRLDNVILCGCVVDPDFDWKTVVDRHQVNTVRNETGGKDIYRHLRHLLRLRAGLRKAKLDWLVGWLLPDGGPACTDGFRNAPDRIQSDHFPDFGHSDYLEPGHATDNWIPYLQTARLNPTDQNNFRSLLELAAQEICEGLDLPSDQVRASIMLLDSARGELFTPEGLAYPMNLYRQSAAGHELSLRIPLGRGAPGRAFTERALAVLPLRNGLGNYLIPDSERRKLNRTLNWVVAAPIPDCDDPLEFGVVGVLVAERLKGLRRTTPFEQADQDFLAQSLGSAARKIGELWKKLV